MRKILWKTIAEGDDCVHVGWTDLSTQVSVAPHTHDFAEVFWVQTGVGMHVINDVKYKLYANDLVCIRPTDRHAYRRMKDQPFTFINVAVPADLVRDLADRYFEGDDGFWGGRDDVPRVIRLAESQREQLDRAAASLVGNLTNRLRAEHLLTTTCLFLDRNDVDEQLRGCPLWLRQACTNFDTPAGYRAGPSFLAKLTGRSVEHISRVLKQQSGMTPGQLLNSYRMRYAATLLQTTDQEILDIALDCGFQSLSHFYQVFGKHFGLTPRNFRKHGKAALPRRGGAGG